MNIITPNYYQKFQCIADRCKHNCCIGWEIDIDDETYKNYQNIEGNFGARFKTEISFDDTPHFRLGEGERCPFLNDSNLCDIILNLGENALCQICTDHPRFRNFYTNYTEIGLGLCCEEAGRLILSQTEPMQIPLPAAKLLPPEETSFFNIRSQVFSLLQDRSLPLFQRIEKLLRKFQLTFPQKTCQQWAEIYLSLELKKNNMQIITVEDGWMERLQLFSQAESIPCLEDEWEIPFEQLLCYFVYRHFSGSLEDGRLKERILFSVLGAFIIAGLFQMEEKTIEQLVEIARLYSSEIEYSEENTEALLELLQ